MKGLRYCLLLFLPCLYSFAFSQKNNIQFNHIGIAEGLSQSNVTCIMQDSRGFMWFGTWNGLNKYDGYTIKVYKNEPLNRNSITDNYIKNIAESKNGDLWIATGSGGMCRYDRNNEHFTRYIHDPKNVNSISDDVVNSIHIDGQGKLWIGTNGGLDIFDPAKNKFQHFTYNPSSTNSLSDSHVNYIFQDAQHELWLCTSNGIKLFNSKTGTFKSFQHDKINSKSIGSDNITTMFEDSKHRLWIGIAGAGMDLLNRETGEFYHYKHDENNPNSLLSNFVSSINEDHENNLWIGSANGGLSVFNYATGLITNYQNDLIDKESISNNSINCIYRDVKNNMWVGTFDAGVDLANRDKIRFTHFKRTMQNSLSNNHVLSIFEDKKNNIWIGTDGGGLNLFDPRTRSFKHFRHEKNNEQSICGDYVVTACEDSEGNIWIGTWADGVTVYSPASNTFKHFKNDPGNPSSLSNNNAWIIYEDYDKNIWIGTSGGGLNLLNPGHNSFTHYQYDRNRSDGISATNINFIFEDSDNELWICTEGGLDLFNKKTKTFSRFLHDDTKNSISNNNVNSIFEDSNKSLWIATKSGLNQLNKKTGKFKAYTMADGLPGNEILGILEDGKKNLWISTDAGISRFSLLSKLFKNFSVADGLQSNEFKVHAFCKSKSGMMYFGGNNGFNQFFPGSIKTIAFDPPLVITDFQIFNKKVSIATSKDDPSPLTKNINETQSITLPYSKSVFSFEFATLNYTASDKKQYAYMLEGFDKNWNEVGTTRTATYTNLDPGKYVFKVRGLNNEGALSSNIKSIELIITPPYWLTWWFKSIVLLLIIGGVFGFYKFRINIIHAQKRKLEQRVHEQTEQLIKSTGEEQTARKEAEQANIDLERKNQEMQQFSYIISHNLRRPVANIIGFSEMLSGLDLDEETMEIIVAISASSEKLDAVILDLNEILKVRKDLSENKIPVCLSILVKDITTSINSLIKEEDVQIRFDFTEADELVTIKSYLYSIFYNLITNSIKYHQPGINPEINIKSCRHDNKVTLVFSDNGMGMDLSSKGEQVFGLYKRFHTHIEGKGLGLFMTKTQVETLGGKINVESEVNKGTTFKIQFNI